MSKKNNTPRTQAEALSEKYDTCELPFSVVEMTFCEGIEEELVEANRKLDEMAASMDRLLAEAIEKRKNSSAGDYEKVGIIEGIKLCIAEMQNPNFQAGGTL